MGDDGQLTDAGMDMLRLPYCVINLADETSFECELATVQLGPPRRRKTCLRLESEYIGACPIRPRIPGESKHGRYCRLLALPLHSY
eukprot:SAG22_NODE_11296_length_491_cov_1.923469_1_plen_86_part_10